MGRRLRVPSNGVDNGLAKGRLNIKANGMCVAVRLRPREISAFFPVDRLLSFIRRRVGLTTSFFYSTGSFVVRYGDHAGIYVTRILGVRKGGLF